MTEPLTIADVEGVLATLLERPQEQEDAETLKLVSTIESGKTDQIDAAILAAQGSYSPVVKSTVNPHFGSRYADLTAIMAATRPALREQGVLVRKHTLYLKWVGRLEMFLVVKAVHPKSGQFIQAWWWIEEQKTPQAYGSALTYGKRYPVSGLIGVEAEEDDDGNAASPQDSARQGSRRREQDQPKATVSEDDLTTIRDTTEQLTSIEAVKEYWNSLGAGHMLTDEVKSLLTAKATALGKAAEQDKAAETPPTEPAATSPAEPEPAKPAAKKAQPKAEKETAPEGGETK